MIIVVKQVFETSVSRSALAASFMANRVFSDNSASSIDNETSIAVLRSTTDTNAIARSFHSTASPSQSNVFFSFLVKIPLIGFQ